MSLFAAAAEAFEPRDHAADVFAAIGYTPTARQQLFHDATEWDVLYGGAAGGGKTAALVADDILDAIRHPGIRIAAFRRSYPEVMNSLVRQLASFGFARKLGARWNAGRYELTFPSGSVVTYGYAENIVDASRQQGNEYQKLSIDESSQMDPVVVDMLRERLRSGRADIPVLGVRSASNPGGVGHAYLKARFVDGTDYGAKTYTDEYEHSVRFIPSKVDDNPHVDAGYRRNLEAIPDPARRAAFLNGDWDQFAGAYFPEFSRDRHIVPNTIEIPPFWQRYAGIDWGYAAPWAVVWAAKDEDGRLWLYRERYQTKVGEVDQARMILEAERAAGEHDSDEQKIYRYADDAMWIGRGSAKSIAQVYAGERCWIREAKKGERLPGWQRVHSYLADGPACPHHRAEGLETCPMLHVLEGRLPNLVREITSASHDERKPEDLNTAAPDHALDALRYMCINIHGRSIDRWLHAEETPANPRPVGPTEGLVPMLVECLDELEGTWQEALGVYDESAD